MYQYRPSCFACCLNLCLLLIACVGCSYEFEEVPFTNVEAKPQQSLSIKLNPAVDTIRIRGDASLLLEFNINPHDIMGYVILVDNVVHLSTEYFPNPVYFSTNSIPDGYHKLELRIRVRSKTGSLADQLGVEYYEVVEDWVLYINNASVRNYAIDHVKLERENGRLKMTWPAYGNLNFVKYLIVKQDYLGYESTDASVTNWIDSGYVGASISYGFNVFVTDENNVSKVFTLGDYKDYLVQVEQLSKEGSVRLKWKQCEFYNNFDQYQVWDYIWEYNDFHWNAESILQTKTISDTSLVIPEVPFGALASYGIETIGKKDVEKNKLRQRVDVTRGETHAWYAVPQYFPYQNALMYPVSSGSKREYLHANTEQHLYTEFDNSYNNYFWKISLTGESLWKSERGRFTQNYLEKFDPKTFQSVEKIYLHELLKYPAYIGYNGAASYNDIIVFTTVQYPYNFEKDSLYVVNLKTRQTLSSRYAWTTPGIDDCNVLPGGGMLKCGDYFYNPKNLQESYVMDQKPYVLVPDNSNTMWAGKDRLLQLIDCKNRQLLREFAVEDPLEYIDFDAKTGYLGGLVAGKSKYRIYDPATNKLVKEILISPQAKPKMVNKALFTENFKLPLDL